MNNFGQLRGSQENNFMQSQSVRLLHNIPITSFDNTAFQNDGFDYAFDANTSYYLQFQIKTLENDAQTIYLKLINGQNEGVTQLIQTYKIPATRTGQATKSYLFQIIFTPNGNYSSICWELLRTATDYSDVEGQRRTNITLKNFSILNNFITTLPNRPTLKKIGVQGPPSMLMCINGEQIRIGKSGVYELNNGININFISFVPKSQDYFIMDYQY